MKIDNKIVCVDVKKCEQLAMKLQAVEIPIDREESSLPTLDRQLIGNFYLFVVAICHQTSPQNVLPLKGVVEGKELRGWDFLVGKLEHEVSSQPEILSVDSWSTFTPVKLRNLYHDDEFGDRLTDITGRVLLIKNLGHVMKLHGWLRLEDIYNACNKRAATGNPNLLSTLNEFNAFRDPVKKKSLFLLSLMRNSGLWRYPDEKQLRPPVDYHEVRGHLRIGTVKIHDANLRRKLLDRKSVTEVEDILIRQAVMDAIMEISIKTKKTPSQLHYLFWNIFRSCCTRESPHCIKCPSESKISDRYQHLTRHSDGNHCPFSGVCESAFVTNRYTEHLFDTDYY